MRLGWLLAPAALGVSLTMSACGGSAAARTHASTGAGKAPPGVELTRSPAAVGAICRKLVRSNVFPVQCPAAWPVTAAPGEPEVEILARTRSSYLVNAFNGIDDRSPHVFHLLFGGQAAPFTSRLSSIDPGLRVTVREVRIPKQGGGTFIQQRPARYIGGATVHGHAARLLQEPPYPQGGVQGGHVLVLWNQAGHGYLVSVHGEGLSRHALIAGAVAIARSTAAIDEA